MNAILDLLKSLLGKGTAAATGGQSGTEVLHQSPDLLQATQASYLFHRNTYRQLVWLSLMETGILIVLICVSCLIIITANPQDRFFVASVDGRISRIIPLDTPLANNGEMYSRVGSSVAAAMTFGFLDYEQRKIETGTMFDPQALAALYKALTGSDDAAAVTQNNQIFRTKVEASRPGGVISQGVDNHIYQWVIDVPVSVLLESGAEQPERTQTPWNVKVLVQRAKALEAKNGLVISRVLAAAPSGRPVPVSSDSGDTP